jgi:maleylacetoacetate isomerase
MKLYAYPFSSASYRARIVLHLKGIPFETINVSLAKKEQREAAFTRVNPQQRIPVLELDDGTRLTQSLAIIDYLDRTYPAPPVYPADPVLRARAIAVALAVAAEIQPVNSPAVLDYVADNFPFDQTARDKWATHFMHRGLAAIEELIDGQHYCFGVEPTIADICLVPQVLNAHRARVDISDLPKVNAVFDVANGNPAFQKAHPTQQPNAG